MNRMNGHKKTTTRHIQCVVHVFCFLSLILLSFAYCYVISSEVALLNELDTRVIYST